MIHELTNNHRFLAMMLHGWGSGASRDEAIKNMKLAMGISQLPAQYFVKEFSEPCDPYVNEMGTINWWDETGTITATIIEFKIRGKAVYTGDDAHEQFEAIKSTN